MSEETATPDAIITFANDVPIVFRYDSNQRVMKFQVALNEVEEE